MPDQFASPLQVLALATHTSADDWESLDGPDSGVGVDYWYRHRDTGKEAYLNLDQYHLTISVAGQPIYDAEIPDEAELASKAGASAWSGADRTAPGSAFAESRTSSPVTIPRPISNRQSAWTWQIKP